MAEKMSVLRKKLVKLGYELDFMDAPTVLTRRDIPFDIGAPAEGETADSEVGVVGAEDQSRRVRAWYRILQRPEDLPYLDQALHPPSHCENVDCPSAKCAVPSPPSWYNMCSSEQAIEERLATHGPYEGIFGFSQGGCVAAALLCSGKQPIPVKWVISVASCALGGLRNEKARGTECALRFKMPNLITPTLLVGGARDQLVELAQTKELHERWLPNAIFVEHDGGHCVPTKAAAAL